MAKTRQQKEEIINQLKEKFSQMKSVVFTDYFGLTVKEMRELKKMMKKENSEYLIAKKTLLARALEELKISIDLEKLTGGIALAFGYQDEIAPARILAKFAKEHQRPELTGGIIANQFVKVEEIKKIANLPSTDVLRGRLVNVIASPLSKLTSVLQGNLRNLVYLLNALKEKAS